MIILCKLLNNNVSIHITALFINSIKGYTCNKFALLLHTQ